MRTKEKLLKEFIDVSEKPDFPDSNKMQLLEVLIDIRDLLSDIEDATRIYQRINQ